METTDFTRAERIFRGWMFISYWMYAFGAVLLLAAGAQIPSVINYISAKLFSLPLYPLPAGASEGAFWRVLGVSMMAMLTWICRAVYLDVRQRGGLVPILLLAKACSTGLYFLLFLKCHYLAYLVGALADGPIFAVTLGLWFQASPGGRFINAREEEILAAIGDALMPRGGAFAAGYLDLREASLADARRIFAALDAGTLLVTRLTLRALNLAPLCVGLGCRTFLALRPADQSLFLIRLERHRSMLVRMLYLPIKLFVLLPFFNQPAAYRAVGYFPEAE